jgi:hypothetical protein
MQKAVFTLLVLAMTIVCTAQTTIPTIKGHKLGETLQQFIAESNNVTREEMQKCQAGSPTLKEDKEFAKRCEEFLQTLNTSPVNGTFQCAGSPEGKGYTAEFTRSFIDGANTACFELLGKVTFENDRLVKFDLNFSNHPWEEVLPDIITKFGKPTATHVDAWQNGYGAKFDLRTATWITHEYVVVASERLNLPYSLVMLMGAQITDHKYFEEQQAKNAHGSVLD